jgi:hypothetical protein
LPSSSTATFSCRRLAEPSRSASRTARRTTTASPGRPTRKR